MESSDYNKKSVKVFTGANHEGSLQHIHFYEDKKSMMDGYEKMKIKDEFDHSFVFSLSNQEIYVLWRNKDSPIQFCGSGAYAVSAYLMNKNNLDDLTLRSLDVRAGAKLVRGKVWVEFPERLGVDFIGGDSRGKYFYHAEDGTLFYLLNEKRQLFKENPVGLPRGFDEKVDAICVFYWDDKASRGFLRYFAPKFGRDEDCVTGSVHRWLTPLVFQLFEKPEQEWEQGFQTKGSLSSRLIKGKVMISGNWDAVC